MEIHCMILSDGDLADVRKEITRIRELVDSAAGTLAVRVRTRAPMKTGALISGIIPSPWEERSKYPGKIVRQVYMDAGMNDTFVKVSKAGKRYYYPASQEYGFRIAGRKPNSVYVDPFWGEIPVRHKVYGKYFMRDTLIDYVPAFESDFETLVDKVVSK